MPTPARNVLGAADVFEPEMVSASPATVSPAAPPSRLRTAPEVIAVPNPVAPSPAAEVMLVTPSRSTVCPV